MNFFRRMIRLAAMALLWGVWGAAANLTAEDAPQPVILKEVAMGDFAGFQPGAENPIKAAFKDRNFSLKEAANLNEVYGLLRVLSPDEERFLQKNRFLVLPKPRFWLYPKADGGGHDEMLGNFDALGGSYDETLRAPQNARFISPDIFLHAFYKYNASRLAALEKGVLRESARYMLTELYDNAARLGQGRSGRSAENWERLRAQLLVPLILIDNCAPDPEPQEPGEPKADSLENAWKRFEPYRPSFSRSLGRSVWNELERVYRAEGRGTGLLGLVGTDNDDGLIDYRAFIPRGRQAAD